GKDGMVKILDMGLARSTDPSDDGTLTQEGSMLGTADFISPEQALSAHTVDIRADIYSLGATFYFLLTGKAPFPGGSLAEKLLKHQLREPEPLENLRPGLPPKLVALVKKMMAKNPDERYQTPAEMIAELADPNVLLPGPIITDDSDSASRRRRLRRKRSYRLLAAGVISLLAAVALPVGYFFGGYMSKSGRDVPVAINKSPDTGSKEESSVPPTAPEVKIEPEVEQLVAPKVVPDVEE